MSAPEGRVPGLLPGLLLAAVGFAWCWTAFYPGFMSYDSLVQYAMSRGAPYDDWNPPLMSWTWGWLNALFPGPSGMLALQLSLLWTGLLAWWAAWRAQRCAWLLLAVGLAPWVLNFAGVLWKDVLMAGALLLAAALASAPGLPLRLLTSLALVFFAINLRYNAVFAAVPLLWCMVRSLRPTLGRPGTAAATLVFLAACVSTGSFITYQLLGAKRSQPSNYMMLDDLVHLSLSQGRSVVPGVDMRLVQECAARELGQTQLVGKFFCLRDTQAGRAAAESPALRQTWRTQVLEHPWDWLRFRAAAFAYLLRSPQQEPYYIWHPGVDENKLGVQFTSTVATNVTQRWVQAAAAAAPLLFKPYSWLALDLVLLLLLVPATPGRTVRAARMLLGSSALYTLGYLPVTPMADFRYIYWSVLASTTALMLLGIERNAWLGLREWRRHGPLLTAAVLVVFALPLAGRVLSLNVDAAVLRTLTSPATPLPPVASMADLQPDAGRLRVVGVDPWLRWNLVPAVSPAAYRFLKLDFSCQGGAGRPVLQLFWWGDEETGPAEVRSWTTVLREGTQLLPLSGIPGLPTLSTLKGLRLDLFDPAACQSITLNGVALVP